MDKRVFLFLVFAFVIAAGCEQNGPKSNATPYCGGSEGLEIKFVEGSPPSEVFDNSQFPFDITLRLLNKGEYDVQPSEVKIELSGISPIDFGGPSYVKVLGEKITGKNKDQNGNCNEGDALHASFGGSGEEPFKYKHRLSGNQPFPLRADVCYKYRTKSRALFCVQKELPRFGQEPTCKVDEAKPVFNSGAPIHVDSFKQSPGGENKIAFAFEITHKGAGQVHSGELCDSSITNRNKVRVKVTSSVGRITCSSLNGANEGDVVLNENKRIINCIMDTSGVSGREFETLVNIDIDYNYKQHDDTAILVKRLG